MKPQYDDECITRIPKRRRKQNRTQALLFWKVLSHHAEGECQDDVSSRRVQYISVRTLRGARSADFATTHDAQPGSVETSQVPPAAPTPLWSCPVRLKLGEAGKGCRQNVAVPSPTAQQLYDVSAVCSDHVTYLQLSSDTHAQVELHNNTAFALHFGQAYTDPMQNGLLAN